MRKYYWCTLVVLLSIFGSCEDKVNNALELQAVTETIEHVATVLETEERQLMEQIFTQDSTLVVIGTDVGEYLVGWHAFKASIQQQFADFDSTKLSTRDRRIRFNTAHNTAWFSEIMDWEVQTQEETVTLNDTRVTGVLTKQERGWRIEQLHVSVPVDGQAAPY